MAHRCPCQSRPSCDTRRPHPVTTFLSGPPIAVARGGVPLKKVAVSQGLEAAGPCRSKGNPAVSPLVYWPDPNRIHSSVLLLQ